MSFLPELVNLPWGSGCSLQLLILCLMNKHVGSQVSRCTEGLGAKGAVECALWLLALVCVLFSSNCLLCRHRGLLAGLLRGGERVGFAQSVLAAVCLHVLSEGKFFPAFRAAEGLLACVQILMLMEKAAVLEGLTADVAQVRARVVCVLAAVVFHDGVVFENHAALWAFIGFKCAVTPLVVAQGYTVRESLIALLACEDALL